MTRIDTRGGWVCPRNFACNSPVGFSIFEIETLKSCGFWGVVEYGRQGIACGIGGCGAGGRALVAGRRTLAAVVLVSMGAAPDP